MTESFDQEGAERTEWMLYSVTSVVSCSFRLRSAVVYSVLSGPSAFKTTNFPDDTDLTDVHR
jgi:hypothetical protein